MPNSPDTSPKAIARVLRNALAEIDAALDTEGSWLGLQETVATIAALADALDALPTPAAPEPDPLAGYYDTDIMDDGDR